MLISPPLCGVLVEQPDQTETTGFWSTVILSIYLKRYILLLFCALLNFIVIILVRILLFLTLKLGVTLLLPCSDDALQFYHFTCVFLHGSQTIFVGSCSFFLKYIFQTSLYFRSLGRVPSQFQSLTVLRPVHERVLGWEHSSTTTVIFPLHFEGDMLLSLAFIGAVGISAVI